MYPVPPHHRRIGRARRGICSPVGQDHHNVVLVARSEDRLQQLAADLEKRYGIKAHVFASDLSLPAQHRRWLSRYGWPI